MDVQFGAFRLLGHLRELHGPSGVMQLGDRSCEILQMLLECANKTVGKQDLLDTVWPNIAVEENTLQVHISTLRKALGPDQIRTVHGRGYQYVGPAPAPLDHEKRVEPEPLATTPDLAALTRVMVAPFANLTDDRAQDFFAEGLWENLVIELARFRNLAITPFHETPGAGARDTTLLALAQEAGVDFFIEGTIRLTADTVRVNARLTDASTGTLAWGERFDFALADAPTIQDEIADAVVSHLSLTLDDAAGAKRQKNPVTSETAHTSFLKARSAWRAGDEAQALQFAIKATEIDPQYGRAQAYVGYFYAYSQFTQHLGLTEQETFDRANEAVGRAAESDLTDPFILQYLAMTQIMLGRPRDGLRYAEVARKVSARDSETLIIHGQALTVCGQYDQGLALVQEAMSQMERFLMPPGFYCALAECRHICGDYAGSLEAIEMLPNPPYYMDLLRAANLARLGKTDAARRIVAEAPEGFSTARFAAHEAKTCAQPCDIEHWLKSFRLAGIDV